MRSRRQFVGSIKRKIDYLYNELFSSDKSEESLAICVQLWSFKETGHALWRCQESFSRISCEAKKKALLLFYNLNTVSLLGLIIAWHYEYHIQINIYAARFLIKTNSYTILFAINAAKSLFKYFVLTNFFREKSFTTPEQPEVSD